MSKMITGYQYGDDKSFIGTYTFPNNLDKKEIHLPPNTTLRPPPVGLLPGKEAWFDETQNAWAVRDEDLSWIDDATKSAMIAAGEWPYET